MLKEDAIKENLTILNQISHQMTELARIKEELEARTCALLEHGDDGSKTYHEGRFKVTVTTGYNYSLNKDEYEVLGSRLPKIFDPVIKRIAYDLDKNVIREAEKYASAAELSLLSQLITKKPKKLHVKISSS